MTDIGRCSAAMGLPYNRLYRFRHDEIGKRAAPTDQTVLGDNGRCAGGAPSRDFAQGIPEECGFLNQQISAW